MAEAALEGVGDATLGEWIEHSPGSITVHLRRRLSEAEREQAGGLEVRDIRGTPEVEQRLRALVQAAPYLAGIRLTP